MLIFSPSCSTSLFNRLASNKAIEIDGETYHNPNKVFSNKYYDDLTKQNSLIYHNWKIYRWVYNQLKHQPEKVKDELRIFVGEIPTFRMLEDYLPKQKGCLGGAMNKSGLCH
jgi:hypothetical protein